MTHRSKRDSDFRQLEATILLADLRGFTGMSAGHGAVQMIEALNEHLTEMSRIVVRNHGRVDKFMGDAIMAVFGAPSPSDDDASNAVRCAVEMQARMVAMNADHLARGLPEMFIGIGVHTGEVTAGVLGSESHREYAVIGRTVNLAARIEAFSLRGQILISEATFARARGSVATAAPMDVFVKGEPVPVRVREVRGIPSLGLEVPGQDVRRSPRVAVQMPVRYELLQNKIVMPGHRQGTALDIGYRGMQVALDGDVDEHAEVKLDFDLSIIDSRASDIYGKAVRTIRRDGRLVTGIEFTSLSPESEGHVRRFVQLLLQGSEER